MHVWREGETGPLDLQLSQRRQRVGRSAGSQSEDGGGIRVGYPVRRVLQTARGEHGETEKYTQYEYGDGQST